MFKRGNSGSTDLFAEFLKQGSFNGFKTTLYLVKNKLVDEGDFWFSGTLLIHYILEQ
jgi:hypothetical protein